MTDRPTHADMAADNKPRWLSPLPECCQVCGTGFNNQDKLLKNEAAGEEPKAVFVDANIGGTWGLACLACFLRYGTGLGIGRGQMYLVEPPHYKIGG